MTNNSTRDSFGILETSSYYCACIMVFLCTVGLFGNALSILVFSTKKMRSCPINILCLALGLTDFLLLLVAGPLMALPPILASTSDNLSPLTIRFINYSVLYLYPGAMMLQTASVWICSLISVERFLAVCYPLMVAIYCTVRRSIIALVFVFAFSVVYNFVRFWEFHIPSCNSNCSQHEPSSEALLKADKAYLLWFVTIAYNVTHLGLHTN